MTKTSLPVRVGIRPSAKERKMHTQGFRNLVQAHYVCGYSSLILLLSKKLYKHNPQTYISGDTVAPVDFFESSMVQEQSTQ